MGTGRMVRGPAGFFWVHRRTPRYAKVVLAYANLLPLRRRRVTIRDGQAVVDGPA